MSDPKIDVDKVAKLAKLKLSPGEHEKLGKQFSGLIQHFSKIQELKTEGVEPMVYPFDLRDVLREDAEIVAPPREELLRNAPERHENFYRVPKVIEG